jgi:hypothetical protein
MFAMFSERLQKMREDVGTAYVREAVSKEGDLFSVFESSRTSPSSSRDFASNGKVVVSSASSACPVQLGMSSGRGSERELTCVTWRVRLCGVPAMAANDDPSRVCPPREAPPEEKHAPRARARCRVIAGTDEDEQTRREGGLAGRAADATAGACAHAAFARQKHADDARDSVRLEPLRSENDALARGRSAHRAPDIFLFFSGRPKTPLGRKDAPDATTAPPRPRGGVTCTRGAHRRRAGRAKVAVRRSDASRRETREREWPLGRRGRRD